MHGTNYSGFRPYSTPSSRWAALSSRDKSADTHFVYGVRSTKIYCRPICPARLARRANVEFFDHPTQAVAAGFRPCKRCKPETVIHFDLIDEDKKRRRDGIQRAIQLMTLKKGAITLDEAAKEAAIGGKWHFLRIFKEMTGETPGALMARLRKDTALGAQTSGSPASHSTDTDSTPITPVNGSRDPLDLAWITTDATELERIFSEMFTADAALENSLLGETIFPGTFGDETLKFHVEEPPPLSSYNTSGDQIPNVLMDESIFNDYLLPDDQIQYGE